MYILAIETTGPFGSAALLDEKGKVYACEVSKDTMSHLKDLIPMIDKVTAKTGISKDEISILAASVGPGSFTGIRIGVSTARALSQALEIKSIPVPTLDSFMFKNKNFETMDTEKKTNRVICPIINARRGQVYGMVEGYLKAGPYMLTDVLNVIINRVMKDGKDVLFFGDGIDAYSNEIETALDNYNGRFFFAEKDLRYQDAVSVGRFAIDCINKAGGFENCAVSYELLLPEYMRRAEAEQKLEAGQLPICKGPRQE